MRNKGGVKTTGSDVMPSLISIFDLPHLALYYVTAASSGTSRVLNLLTLFCKICISKIWILI